MIFLLCSKILNRYTDDGQFYAHKIYAIENLCNGTNFMVNEYQFVAFKIAMKIH